MKKIIPGVIVLIMVITAIFIGIYNHNNIGNDSSNNITDSSKISSQNDTSGKKQLKDSKKDKKEKEEKEEKEEKLAKKIDSKGKDTLLIYMVGSDLESRSGAGTDDLNEIAESGIDLKKANVLVYAGGSQKWHNDSVNEGKNTVMQLGKKGFEPVVRMDSKNMGDSEALLEFLNYGYSNYPSDSYSLIMWDHGNGPVIGYGKDMLFDNDSLTLSEMKKALQSSPFGKDKKFEWVGFDACLMSSAELVCTWSDYAKYLVASQEVEPSFGWNYDFLKDFGKKDTVAFTKSIVDKYIKGCNDYYEKKGYKDRDTTLACIDLSYAAALESAINKLFSRADGDIQTKYNSLVVKRVGTRALGRASTGSEYDLIDLDDMSKQLSEFYPDEAGQLCDIIGNAVIKNGTNTQGCCGLSIYYPFYNKYYYEDSWGEAYGKIGLFEKYQSYLNKYQEIWLKDDKLEKYASSITPTEADNRSGFDFGESETKKYQLKLTEEQNNNFAEAKFYILKKMEGELYHIMFASNDVKNTDGVLTADFDGKGIYVKNKFDEYHLPVMKMYDKVGDITRYSLLTTYSYSGAIQGNIIQFQIALNNQNNQVNISSIVPYNDDNSQYFLGGGKREEFNINDLDSINLVHYNYAYLQRYENGIIKPIEKWIKKPAAASQGLYVKDGIDFVYSPLDDGQYYLMFEITDTQNNKYCSELYDIYVEETKKEYTYKPEDINITWENGDKVKIYESNGVSAYLKFKEEESSYWYPLGKAYYILEVENNNDYDVTCKLDDVSINDNIWLGYGTSVTLSGKEKYEQNISVLSSKENVFDVIENITKISGNLNIYSNQAAYTIEKKRRINVSITETAEVKNLCNYHEKLTLEDDFLGAHAEKQVIFDNETLKITLEGFGKKSEYSSGTGILCIENMSNTKDADISLSSIAVNDITINYSAQRLQIPCRCKAYTEFSVDDFKCETNNITGIESLKLAIGFWDKDAFSWFGGPYETNWAPIDLDKKGIQTLSYINEGNVIFEKNGVKILIDKCTLENGRPCWEGAVINDSDENISIHAVEDYNKNTKSYINSSVGAHQRAKIIIEGDEKGAKETTFKLAVMNFESTKVLFMGDEPITLSVNLKDAPEDINLYWEDGDSFVIYEEDEYSLILKKIEYAGKPTFVFALDNRSPVELSFELNDIILNNEVSMYGSKYLTANAGEIFESYGWSGIPGYTETSLGALDNLTSISFTLKYNGNYKLSSSLDERRINISLSDKTAIKNIKDTYKPTGLDVPYMGAIASEQTLYKDNNVKIKLLKLGGYEYTYNYANTEIKRTGYSYGLCVENLTDETQKVYLESLSINDITIHTIHDFTVPPKCKEFYSGTLSEGDYEYINIYQYNISDVNDIKLAFALGEEITDNLLWTPVKLDKASQNIYQFNETGDVIFEKEGVRILLESYTEEKGYSEWNVSVINNRDDSISLWLSNSNAKREAAQLSSYSVVGPHQKIKTSIMSNDRNVVDELFFKLNIKDFFGKNILFSDDGMITLKSN